ncbi:hypothetical protein HY989_00090 [Candidatus Micrarchaeota archaeon]|nr:hypothetical protein [Candidatus Micrarchaeota archaeon]
MKRQVLHQFILKMKKRDEWMLTDSLLSQIWSKKTKNAAKIPISSLKSRKVFSGFNAITDAVVKFSSSDFESELKNCNAIKLQSLMHKGKALASIETKEEFFFAFIQMFSKGKALELPSSNEKLFSYFKLKFKEKLRMGGQAGIIANQLARLGLNSVCYAPLISRQQARLFLPGVFFPFLQYGNLAYKKPIACIRDLDDTKTNWIFEFGKGDKLKFNGKTIICPRSNRLIVASRPKAYLPLFEDALLSYLPSISSSFNLYFLAGFSSFQITMQGRHFRHYLHKLLWQITQLKKNKNAKLHLEYVAIHNPELESAIYPSLLPLFDSFGINEVETMHFLKMTGDNYLSKQIGRHESPMNFYLGIRRIFHKFKLNRLHAHTLGYFFLLLRKEYVGLKSPNDFVSSLLFASRVADARASLGVAASIHDVLKFGDLKMSKIGIDAMNSFANEFIKSKPQRQKFLLNGYFEIDDHFVIMVPTSIVRAKSTVGLGDTISSIAFASEPL